MINIEAIQTYLMSLYYLATAALHNIFADDGRRYMQDYDTLTTKDV